MVHCYAGVSRSAAVVLAYLMVHERMHLHLAIKLLRQKHAISRPNQGFMNQLLRFYYRIKQKNGDNFFRGESCFNDEDWGLVFGIVDPSQLHFGNISATQLSNTATTTQQPTNSSNFSMGLRQRMWQMKQIREIEDKQLMAIV